MTSIVTSTHHRTMKKQYTSPAACAVALCGETPLLTGSLKTIVDDDNAVNTDATLSNEKGWHSPIWGE